MPRNIWRRLSLRTKLYLNLGALCGVLALVAVFATWSMTLTANMSRDSLRTSVHQADVAAQVAEATLQCRRFEKDLFLNLASADQSASYATEWREAFATLTATIAEFRAAAATAADHTTAEAWSSDAEQYRQAMNSVFNGITHGTILKPEQANQAITPFKESIRNLTALATETSRRKMDEARGVEKDMTAATGFLQKLLLCVTVVAIFGSAVWCYWLTADLMRPIKALCDLARRVGAGDWYARADLDRDDELGQLADHFNQMTADLRARAEGKPR